MRKTKEAAKQTRQALVNSALTLFAENGYNQTTLVHIVEKTGVTRGALYHHFKNKEDILQALITDCYSDHIEQMEKVFNHIRK